MAGTAERLLGWKVNGIERTSESSVTGGTVLLCEGPAMRLSQPGCYDPSHGGFYMAEGAFYIRIGLPPHVVSGDCLALSLYGLIDHYLCFLHAHV